MNQVVVTATVTRKTTQQVAIVFDKSGTGDDIVDDWADRMITGMKATIACTERAKEQQAMESVLRHLPPIEKIDLYYSKIYTCANCDWIQMLWYLKQNRAASSVTCEKCQCSTAGLKEATDGHG